MNQIVVKITQNDKICYSSCCNWIGPSFKSGRNRCFVDSSTQLTTVQFSSQILLYRPPVAISGENHQRFVEKGQTRYGWVVGGFNVSQCWVWWSLVYQVLNCPLGLHFPTENHEFNRNIYPVCLVLLRSQSFGMKTAWLSPFQLLIYQMVLVVENIGIGTSGWAHWYWYWWVYKIN